MITPAPTSRPRRDEGSALLLVLALMVVGALIVIPLLDYAMSVSRANTILSTKTKRQEAVKAGLRTALADPAKLFTWCEENEPFAPPEIDGIPLSNRCQFLAFSLAADDEDLHLGLVATKVGEKIPDGMVATVEKDAAGDPVLDANGDPKRFVFEDAEFTTDWHPLARPATEPKLIWAPYLPSHALDQRSNVGYQMPTGYPACTVYFPGTYSDPLTITGPAYFASGIYYFENVVTFTAGADVVVGTGHHEGCTNDQEAAFYVETPPATHNISGLGGTFVLGHEAKVVVTNETGSPKLRFNQRYVHASDTGSAPSFGVSIVSVNGVVVSGPDGAGKYVLGPLVVPDVVEVPASVVGTPDDGVDPPEAPLVQAGDARYRPSRLTHEPRPPSPPLTVTAVPLRNGTTSTSGAARVNWVVPEEPGGLPIIEYVATASPGGQTCTSSAAALECVVLGLSHNVAYTFTVWARNDLGMSAASLPSTAVTPRTTSAPLSTTVGPPAAPAAPQVGRYVDDTVEVSWTAPADNNASITSYTVTPTPIPPTAPPCVLISATSCIIRNLPVPVLPALDYTFTVSATNQMGTSPASPSGAPLAVVGDSPLDPEPATPVPPYDPDPIVDIYLPTTNEVVLDIEGYIAIPQGVFQLFNPNGVGTTVDTSTVAVSGGIVAAAFRVDDDRAAPGSGELTVPIGLVNPIIQRTFRIVTQTTSGLPKTVSTAVVQINQNGAYAINSWEVQ